MEKSKLPQDFDALKTEKYGAKDALARIAFQAEARAFNVGMKVKEVRKKRSMTQQQLADKLGMHKSYISKIENGSDMHLSTVFKLFDYGLQSPIKLVIGEIIE